MFSTTRHVSFSTEPGFRYFSDGPLISALASVEGTTCTYGRWVGREKEREITLFNLGEKEGCHELNAKLEIGDNN